MAALTTPERSRLSLDVSQTIKDQLSVLVTRTEAGSITEVIQRALALYDLVTEHQAEGGKLVFRHADGEQEVLRVL